MPNSTEVGRVAALKGYGVLDTPNEPEFDAIVRDAARLLDCPIALISLVDEQRQWFKARVGLDATETPRSISFCTHAIRGNALMVVEDASKDERFASNPLVSGDPSIRFYAGAPLKTPGGHRIGTLCVIDARPRDNLSDREREALEALADETIRAFERRRVLRSGVLDEPVR